MSHARQRGRRATFAVAWALASACRGTPSTPADVGSSPPEADRCAADKPGTRCWVEIPAGTFWMGAQATDPSARGYDPNATPAEGPPHEVSVGRFWMYKTEITASTFGNCLRAGDCRPEDTSADGGYSTFKLLQQQDKVTLPITSITWDGAARLCAWMGGRLPTEAEWEYAARGTDGRRWPWGDEPACGVSKFAVGPPPEPGVDRRQLLTGSCALDGPVAAHDAIGASPFGVLGMAGNVWEWTADAWDAAAYTRHAAQDPVAPDQPGADRTQRGGGWTQAEPSDLRSAGRAHMPPGARLNDVGVRCVWDASRPAPTR
jgi:formylglycine-generating enzyme required for sulfatase activity